MKRITLFIIFSAFIVSLVGAAGFAQQAANPLLDELKSQDANIRARAVRDIGDSGDTSSVQALTAALNDPSPKVRKEIIVALAKLHTNESLDGLVSATRDSDPDVRTMAVEAVVGWYTGNVPSTGFRGAVKKSYNGALNWFQTDTTHIRPGMTVDPKTVAALEADMEDTRSIEASRDAARGLGILLARPAVPALVKASHSPDAGLAVNALDALSKIKDISAGPQVADLLDSPSKDVRRAACITVGILRTKSAAPKLQEIYQTDTDGDTRKAALDGLAFIGDPASYPVFIKALWSQDKDERDYAAEGLARIRDPKAGANLEKRMKIEKDAGVKLAILFAQVSIGETEHLRDLVDALTSRTRGDVAQSYLIELTRQKSLLDAVYSYLNDSNATIRRRLCVVLTYSGDASSLPRLAPLTHDRNNDVAAAALRATQAIRSRAGA
ncbi:MAG TPA: HEAT repeat domain-containing protein [Terriglobia bacterium]|nr:HEAT repeat domain-containing protein [Terriglobia bacterium]